MSTEESDVQIIRERLAKAGAGAIFARRGGTCWPG